MSGVNIFRKHNDIIATNENLPKPPVPEVPNSIEELMKLAGKYFQVLLQGESVAERGGEYHPGGVAITDLLVRCPFCGMDFIAIRRSGCVMRSVFPFTCPNCNFPQNILNTIEEMIWKKK